MEQQYHEYRTQSNYLSSNPDDAGLRYRVSGDLLMVYDTARANPCLERTRKTRTAIRGFSAGTANRMGRYLRESVADYRYMHTLTYPSLYPTDGREVKYHLRRYCQELTRVSKRLGHKNTSLFWFIEFQSRGAPHFHILTTDFYSYKRCAMLWYAIVDSRDEKHLKAGVRVERIKRGKKGMICYAKKYARKQAQKEVPEDYLNVGRFYGVYGLKTCVAAATSFFTDSLRKPHVLEQHERVIAYIRGLIASGDVRLLKSCYGFRLFHVEHLSQSYRLIELFNDVSARIDSRCDSVAHSLGDDYAVAPYLSDFQLELAKRAYLRVKWGASVCLFE